MSIDHSSRSGPAVHSLEDKTWAVASLLFVSGLCALVYQTVWMRELRLVFGASTLAGAVGLTPTGHSHGSCREPRRHWR